MKIKNSIRSSSLKYNLLKERYRICCIMGSPVNPVFIRYILVLACSMHGMGLSSYDSLHDFDNSYSREK